MPLKSSVKAGATSPGGRPLSILLVGTQMALGGAQRLLLDQGRWFHSRGHRVVAAFLYDKQGLEQLWKSGLEFPLITLSGIGSGTGPLIKLGGAFLGLARLWLLIRREKFDVVQSFTYDSNLLVQPVAWLAGVPVRIATHHGIIEGFPRLIERLHSGLVNTGVASILVNVSRKVLEQAAAAGIRREHMTVIPNGIAPSERERPNGPSVRAELGIGKEDLVILSVGRLVYQKGHEYLIQAMHSISKEFPKTTAIICGEGPLRRQLEVQVERLAVQRAVLLPGNRLDIERFLAIADIFALPSRWEGLLVALLEAMERALPVVATRVEGVEEVIEDEGQGLLIPPEDARALAEALRTLVASPGLRRRMGKAGQARVREAYTIDNMCEKYLALMQNLLQARRPVA